MDPVISRRALFGGLAAFPAVARAAATDPRLVVVFADGGWDTTLLLDPKALTAEAQALGETVEVLGGLPLAINRSLRPVTARFFEQWADRATAVNGIWVGSLGHTSCRTRMFHGSPDPESPDLPTLAGLGAATPVGTIDLSGELEPGVLSAMTARLGYQRQLRGLVDPTLAAPPIDPGTGWRPTEAGAAARRAVLDARGATLAATAKAPVLDAWAEARSRAAAWWPVASPEVAGWAAADAEFEDDAVLAPSLLATGQCASVLLALDGWDTHVANETQHGLYERLFAALDHLLLDLDGNGLLDRTLVLVLSEMSRNPTLNVDLGKDHWPLTSALLLGGPVPGGRVLGGTDAGLGALPIDPVSGQAEGDRLLYAADFVAGVLAALGVDPAPWLPDAEPFDALVRAT